MKKMMIAGVAVAVMAVQGCGSKGSVAVESSDFVTDSIGVVDTLQVEGSVASVCISGFYPAGEGVLADSVRMWLADHLANTSSYSGEPLFVVSGADAADGDALIKKCCDSLMDGARCDFVDFAENGFTSSYDYDVRFGPVSESDSLLTYYLTAYGYQGGAHGGISAVNATFNRNNGVILTYDNVFKPECRAQLIEMIKEGLWSQYFEENISEATLADVLLINPDELQLPATLPLFEDNGVVFTYQQYEIAPYAAGMPSCVLTYKQLEPLMRPEVITLLPKSY